MSNRVKISQVHPGGQTLMSGQAVVTLEELKSELHDGRLRIYDESRKQYLQSKGRLAATAQLLEVESVFNDPGKNAAYIVVNQMIAASVDPDAVVTIEVPAAGIRERLLWPELTVGKGPALPPKSKPNHPVESGTSQTQPPKTDGDKSSGRGTELSSDTSSEPDSKRGEVPIYQAREPDGGDVDTGRVPNSGDFESDTDNGNLSADAARMDDSSAGDTDGIDKEVEGNTTPLIEEERSKGNASPHHQDDQTSSPVGPSLTSGEDIDGLVEPTPSPPPQASWRALLVPVLVSLLVGLGVGLFVSPQIFPPKQPQGVSDALAQIDTLQSELDEARNRARIAETARDNVSELLITAQQAKADAEAAAQDLQRRLAIAKQQLENGQPSALQRADEAERRAKAAEDAADAARKAQQAAEQRAQNAVNAANAAQQSLADTKRRADKAQREADSAQQVLEGQRDTAIARAEQAEHKLATLKSNSGSQGPLMAAQAQMCRDHRGVFPPSGGFLRSQPVDRLDSGEQRQLKEMMCEQSIPCLEAFQVILGANYAANAAAVSNACRF